MNGNQIVGVVAFGLVGLMLFVGIFNLIIMRFECKKRKPMYDFLKRIWIKFINSSKIDKYDSRYGKPIDWILWSVKEKYKYDTKTGDQIKLGVEVIFGSKDESQRRAEASDLMCIDRVSSGSHTTRIKLTCEEYERLKNLTLNEELIMERIKNSTNAEKAYG